MRLCTLLPLLLLAACGIPDNEASSSSAGSAGESSSSSSSGSSSSSSSSSGDAGENDTSTSTSDTTGDTSGGSGGWGEGQSTGEPATSCFADSCEDDGACGSGLVCLPHPTSGEHLCVTLCGPPFACNEVSAAMCDDPGPVACLAVGAIKGCFPAA